MKFSALVKFWRYCKLQIWYLGFRARTWAFLLSLFLFFFSLFLVFLYPYFRLTKAGCSSIFLDLFKVSPPLYFKFNERSCFVCDKFFTLYSQE